MKKQLLLFAMILLPLVANAEEVEIDGFYYTLVNKAKEATLVRPKELGEKIVIPETVKYEGVSYTVVSIGGSAFYMISGSTPITSITIPSSIKSIGKDAFWRSSSQSDTPYEVHIKDLKKWCDISFENEVANPLTNGHRLFLNDEEIINLNIPEGVTELKRFVFSGCSNFKSIKLPSTLTDIGYLSFYNCTGLTSVEIPSNVNRIASAAFRNCKNLTKVYISDLVSWCNLSFYRDYTDDILSIYNPFSSNKYHLYINGIEAKDLAIPNSVEIIKESSFAGCIGITSITFPNSVNTIERNSFAGCSSLTSVTIPNSVTSIGDYAFSGCSGLTSITIPNSVTSIGGYAFSGCSGLTSVTIPNSVTSIGNRAFYNCSGLTSVIIGSGIKNIFSLAFALCPELTDVTCYAENVPTTDSYAFKDSYIEYANLHVPASAVNAYKAADPWKNFKNILATDGTTPETPKCEKPTISYENGQLKMSCATEGVEYVTDITDADIKKHYDATISLTATYNISVYATKSGYDNSDVATATLCWIDASPKTEGITNGVAQIAARPVLVKTDNGFITVEGVDDRTNVTVYTTDGKQVGSAISQNNIATIATSIQPGSIAIVKVGDKAVKVVIK